MKLQLFHILIQKASLFAPWESFTSKRAFLNVIRYVPLKYIENIWIVYKIGKDHVLQYKLKLTGDYLWKVYCGDKLFFSFECNQRMDLLKIFETDLKRKLENKMIRTKIPKK